jgi:septum formation protein
MAMLVLASKSEIRRALLAGAGLTFETRSADVNERQIEAELHGESSLLVARRLAEAKAQGVDGRIVVGADQVLSHSGRLLHKPKTLSAARIQLISLRGSSHELHAGVALAVNGRLVWSEVVSARLTMRDFTDAELDHVLEQEGEAVLASVGGYRLEGPSIRLFEAIEGDYFTILGLPLLPLLAALRAHAPQVLGGFT